LSENKKDKRLRSSIMIEDKGINALRKTEHVSHFNYLKQLNYFKNLKIKT